MSEYVEIIPLFIMLDLAFAARPWFSGRAQCHSMGTGACRIVRKYIRSSIPDEHFKLMETPVQISQFQNLFQNSCILSQLLQSGRAAGSGTSTWRSSPPYLMHKAFHILYHAFFFGQLSSKQPSKDCLLRHRLEREVRPIVPSWFSSRTLL